MISNKSDLNEKNLKKELILITERLKIGKLEEALKFPKYFQIETVRICNARCPFCAIDKWDKSVPLMSDKLYDKIVEELSSYSDWIEFVALQRAGEPLLDKKIFERVFRLKKAKIKKISMSTNASMLNESNATKLLEAGLDEIILSIDSIDKENYEKMRVGLNYENTIYNIKQYFKLRDKINPKSVIRVRGVSFYDMTLPEHREEMKRWEAFWSNLRKENDRIYLKRAHNWGNQKALDIPQFDKIENVFHPCIIPWSTMHVTAMGLVPLCPHDYDAILNLGDVNKDTIRNIWNGSKWDSVRKKHSNGERNQISFCQGCKTFDPEFSLEKWQEKQLYEG